MMISYGMVHIYSLRDNHDDFIYGMVHIYSLHNNHDDFIWYGTIYSLPDNHDDFTVVYVIIMIIYGTCACTVYLMTMVVYMVHLQFT